MTPKTKTENPNIQKNPTNLLTSFLPQKNSQPNSDW